MSREGPLKKPPNEFSRPFLTAALREEEIAESIAAEPAERAALAQRFGLIGLERLAARLVLCRAKGGEVVRVAGHLEARATAACVVTLEPVETEIEGDFKVEFAPKAAEDGEPEAGELLLETGTEEESEPLDPSGVIDLGELVAQQLAVRLDPYPRKPGVVYAPPAEGGGEERKDISPFAVLRKPGTGG